MLYSKKLNEIRKNSNLNQIDFAKSLNISRGVYAIWETETEIIPLKHLINISNIYNVSLDYIFDFTDTQNYSNIKKDIDNKIVGERLKEFRKENNLTQAKLASILNTTQTVIAGYESGRRLIATPFLYTICKKYNISADYLLGKTDIK